MAILSEKEQSGVRLYSELMGADAGMSFEAVASSDGFGAAIIRNAASACFHEAWGHEGITRKEKSIAIIAVLVEKGRVQELKNHGRIGIANGLTAAELEGILVQLAPYVGFPMMTSAVHAVADALAEAGASIERNQLA